MSSNVLEKMKKNWGLSSCGIHFSYFIWFEEITEKEYAALVETASKAYGTVKKATAGEVKDFKQEMKKHWQELEKNNAMKKVVTAVSSLPGQIVKKAVAKKTVVKKAAKKAAKKAV